MQSESCSSCDTVTRAVSICTGCRSYFCDKHFLRHREQLLQEFQVEVVAAYNELRQQFNNIKSDDFSADFQKKINEWVDMMTQKIIETAETIRLKVVESSYQEQGKFEEKVEKLYSTISKHTKENSVTESDINDLSKKIKKLKSQTQCMVKSNLHVATNYDVDLSRLIHVEYGQRQGEKPLVMSSVLYVSIIEINASY